MYLPGRHSRVDGRLLLQVLVSGVGPPPPDADCGGIVLLLKHICVEVPQDPK